MYTKMLMSLLAIIISSGSLFAQSDRGSYVKIDYIYVESDQYDKFIDYLNTVLHPYKTERLENVDILEWNAYRVLYPGPQTKPYNFISKTVSASINAFDHHLNGTTDPLHEESFASQYTIVKSELWKNQSSEYRLRNDEPSPYLKMDYMNVALGRELEYEMLEIEIAKPLHERRMEQNRLDGWKMYQLIFPGGVHYGYNYVTANYYSRLADLEFGFTDELIRSENPGVNIRQFLENIWSTRDLVKSEIWMLTHHERL
ncbi:MAG: hypothetical protein ACNA78_00015 [Balneolaceae bacterium]